ncbi:hypothetical protein EYY86_13880 [Hafnia paralvei]|uniref:hypothetical protein n=1 Tax=Hafnia paralvei TaxID=546367 RepID=UPI001034B8B4|nr:hypothetical protein [Hafnia paralvei]TBM13374.1 hypothetical protein EYY86_13880 [Hafnia paralvei]
MNKLKVKFLKKIGLNPYCPRWLKVFFLKLVMREISKGFTKLFKSGLQDITPEKRDEINKLILKMNATRESCHDK